MRTLCAGTVVVFTLWVHAASAQVNLPPGFEIVEFAESDYSCTHADINDCGQIAYAQVQNSEGHLEVFVYENGEITQITNGVDGGTFPYINNHGQMVWKRNAIEIVFYDQGEETVLEENPNGFNGWGINNLGHVTWSRSVSIRCPRQENLFVWDGSTTTQLTFDNELSNVHPNINDWGDVAWYKAQFCDNPWHSEVILRTIDGDRSLPAPDQQNQGVKLANSGCVVWASQVKIAFGSGEDTRIITDFGSVPNLNDRGRVYAPVYDFQREAWQPWVFDVRNDAIDRYRLVEDERPFGRGGVNNWGEVACEWDGIISGRHRGAILLMRRIRTGDSEFDGDVDLRDHRRFVRGMTRPVRTEGLCEDRFSDINYDGDLDLDDYARFQNAFTGASP